MYEALDARRARILEKIDERYSPALHLTALLALAGAAVGVAKPSSA
jgi:hypothetical protein